MESKSIWEMTIEARSDARKAVGPVQYSPWVLALSVSLAWALLVFGTLGAYLTMGLLVGAFTGGLIAPFPLIVTAWTFAAWEVELDRLGLARQLLGLPELPAREDAEPEPEPAGPVELTPGYELNGQIVAPMRELTPEAAALRLVCLRFVRAGQHREGWSRSKIAEGPRKLISGDDWSTASKELQRLGFFAVGKGGALAPTRDVADVLARLEAAR